jgi:hypothetical protein
MFDLDEPELGQFLDALQFGRRVRHLQVEPSGTQRHHMLKGRVLLGGTGTTGHGERRGERNGVKHSLASGLHEQSSCLLVFLNQVVLPWHNTG